MTKTEHARRIAEHIRYISKQMSARAARLRKDADAIEADHREAEALTRSVITSLGSNALNEARLSELVAILIDIERAQP